MVGSPDTIAAGLGRFAETTKPDEQIITSQIYDHASCLRSYAPIAEAAGAG